jgi:hypothetical protein
MFDPLEKGFTLDFRPFTVPAAAAIDTLAHEVHNVLWLLLFVCYCVSNLSRMGVKGREFIQKPHLG